METYVTGTAPAITWHYKGTLAEIRAVAGPEGSLGHPTDSRLELRYRGGQWEVLENGTVDLDTGDEAFPAGISAVGTSFTPPGQAYDAVTDKTTFSGAVSASGGILLPQDPRSVITIGDSHMASLVGSADPLAPLTLTASAQNFVYWWLMYSKWRFSLTAVLAAGGKRTDEVISQQLPILLAAKPGICLESSGTNDALQGIAYATLVANTRIIYDAILNAGIKLRIYIAGVPTAGGGGNATISGKLLQLREWKYRYAAAHPGVVIYDHHALVADFNSSLGAYATNYTADGVHTTHLAAWMGGKAFAELETQISGANNTLSTRLDTIGGISAGAATDDLRQLYGNPGLTGVPVAEGNAGMSGQRPAGGWYGNRSGTGTGVGSVTASGAWNKFQIVKTAAASGDNIVHGYGLGAGDYTRLHAPASRDRLVVLSLRRTIESPSAVGQFNINFNLTAGGVSKTAVSGAFGATSAAHWPNGENMDLEFRTPPIRIPAGAQVTGGSVSVNLSFLGAGSCTDTIQEVRILDITPEY